MEKRVAGSMLTPPEMVPDGSLLKDPPWTVEIMQAARRKYEIFHQIPTGCSTIEHVMDTSLGVEGWAARNVGDWDKLVKVGTEVHPVKLCGLWIKEA